MKIVVLDGHALNPGDLSWDCLRRFGEVTIYDRTPVDLVVSRIGDADIILLNKVTITADILDACPNVKLICVLATGYNVVDCAAARQRGIPVCNVPAYGTDAVAQFTFALLLEICHQVGHHDRAVHAGRWADSPDFCFWDTPQMELAGKTIGIIGFGRIGRAVGRIARAFGMKVLAYNRSRCAEGEAIGEYVALKDLLRRSDIVSLEVFKTDALEDHRSLDGMELVSKIAQELPVAKVANTTWVNVRLEGRKDSAAIASVNEGEQVYVISENNGFENGWTYVLVMNEGQEPLVGYIWHSFLEPIP